VRGGVPVVYCILGRYKFTVRSLWEFGKYCTCAVVDQGDVASDHVLLFQSRLNRMMPDTGTSTMLADRT
jgi:hypothetical protein